MLKSSYVLMIEALSVRTITLFSFAVSVGLFLCISVLALMTSKVIGVKQTSHFGSVTFWINSAPINNRHLVSSHNDNGLVRL